MQLSIVITKLVAIFNPTGDLLYDVVVPAIVMGAGSALLLISGVLDENAVLWCFGVGVLIHFLLLWFASLLIRGVEEDGKDYRRSEEE